MVQILNVEIKPELFSFSDAFCVTRFVEIHFNIKSFRTAFKSSHSVFSSQRVRFGK